MNYNNRKEGGYIDLATLHIIIWALKQKLTTQNYKIMEQTQQINLTTGATKEFTLRDLSPFAWFLIAAHLIVMYCYGHHYYRVGHDGNWNQLSSYEYLHTMNPDIAWYDYVGYLFWAPSDTPGFGEGHYAEEGDSLDVIGWAGRGVFLVMFIAWTICVVRYARAPQGSKKKLKYTVILTFLFAWVMYEAVKLWPYLSYGDWLITM